MSQIPTERIGSEYSCLGFSMGESIEELLKGEEIEIPITTLHGAIYFFGMGLQACQENIPQNPESSIEHQGLTKGILRSMYKEDSETAFIERKMRIFEEAVIRLTENDEEYFCRNKETYQELREFFRRLHEVSEARRSNPFRYGESYGLAA